MPYKDPQKQREAWLRHYTAHKADYLRRAKVCNEEIRERIRGFLALEKAKPCTDCGKTFPHYVMDFDHLPGFKKCFDIGGAVTNRRSLKVIKAEIAKCELVCANCHRERTFGGARRSVGQ